MKLTFKPLQAALFVAFSVPSLLLSGAAMADPATDARIQALEQQVQMLMEKLGKMPAQDANPAPVITSATSERANKFFDAIKSVEFYGNLDVSVDSSTKGLKNFYNDIGGARVVSPVGQNGWQPDVSTNLSYVGVRGSHALNDHSALVYQLETQLHLPATAGSANSTSAQDTTVKGALTSRNSYVGIADADWGALKIGKTDAPYKNSTARMNPFSGMLGDYSVSGI